MKLSCETLERLREATALSIEEWATCLQLSAAGYQKMLLGSAVEVREHVLDDIAEMIELTTEAIVSGNIDYVTVARRHEGHSTYLPEKYSKAAHSRIRTSSHLLDYVEIHYGWRTRSQILRHFQLNESIFSDLEKEISIQFLEDLCAKMSEMGFKIPDFYHIGKYSVVSNYNNVVGAIFRKISTPKLAYETLVSEVVHQYYDRNFVYRLKNLNDNSCIIDVTPHLRTVEELQRSILGSHAVCASRGGTAASIMSYIGAPESKVVHTQCMHQGDNQCRYEIDFEEASRFKAIAKHSWKNVGDSFPTLLSS